MTELIKRHEIGFKKRMETMPELFDLSFWREQESYTLIKQYCKTEEFIFEIGTLSAHHLVLLSQDGYNHLYGIDFVQEAIEQGLDWCKEYDLDITLVAGSYPEDWICTQSFNKVILFDVLEHVPDVGVFLSDVGCSLTDGGQALILVPKGEHYPDECHINAFPNCEWLTKVLSLYFNVIECREVDEGKKLFAVCEKKMIE